MSDTCPTVRIADAEAPGGYIVINESDFDKATHKLFKGAALRSTTPDENDDADIIPAEFPGAQALAAAGITTPGHLYGKTVEDLTQIKGIGKATAAQIVARLGE